jgi:L-lactate utilization protein LutC
MSDINTTIKSTITELVGDSAIHLYGEAITEVSKALEEREYTLREKIVEAAESRGYGSYAVGILNEVGMAERPAPEPEPVVEAPAEDENLSEHEQVMKQIGAIAGTVSELAGTVGKLVSAAERNGISL